MSTATQMRASMNRLRRHFYGSNTIVLRNGTESATSVTVQCTAPSPSFARLGFENTIVGDVTVYVPDGQPALTFDPATGHWAQLNGQWYRVVDVFRHQAESDIGWRLNLRARE